MMGRCFKERSFYRIEHNNLLDNPDQRRLDLDDAIVSSFCPEAEMLQKTID